MLPGLIIQTSFIIPTLILIIPNFAFIYHKSNKFSPWEFINFILNPLFKDIIGYLTFYTSELNQITRRSNLITGEYSKNKFVSTLFFSSGHQLYVN